MSINNGIDSFAYLKGHYNDLVRRFLPELVPAVERHGKAGRDPYRSGSKDSLRVDKCFNDNGKFWFNTNTWGYPNTLINFFTVAVLTGRYSDSKEGHQKFFQDTKAFLGIEERKLSFSEQEEYNRKARIRAAEEAEKERLALIERSITNVKINKELFKRSFSLFTPEGNPNPKAKAIWNYLDNRGLKELRRCPPNHLKYLRCVEQLKYYDENMVEHFDALVCRVQTEKNEGVQLHRTYLQSDGNKANVSCPKKLTSSDERLTSKCRYIPIGEPVDGVIAIAEGIETALSVYLATGIGCYAVVCAQNIKNFVLPDNCHTVIVFADKDKSETGIIAAHELVTKYKSCVDKQCITVLPKQEIPFDAKGIDWNDVLKAYGKEQFPTAKYCVDFAVKKLATKTRLNRT